MTKPTKVILDGDIIAYRSAFWADQEGVDYLPERIAKDIANWTPPDMDEVIIAMSCPREKNYRRSFWPSYKKHREDFKTPDSMKISLECIYNAGFSVRCVDRLEADDLIGMVVSMGQYIGVTVDKDLRQVPGWHWNPDKETEPVYVDLPSADRYFYQQWMTGDSTDNIWGLWKVGPAKASKLLDKHSPEDWDKMIMDMYINEDWTKRPEDKVPEMSPSDFALSQARCVRILRSGDYNMKDKEISLWCPNNLTVRNILDLQEEKE